MEIKLKFDSVEELDAFVRDYYPKVRRTTAVETVKTGKPGRPPKVVKPAEEEVPVKAVETEAETPKATEVAPEKSVEPEKEVEHEINSDEILSAAKQKKLRKAAKAEKVENPDQFKREPEKVQVADENFNAPQNFDEAYTFMRKHYKEMATSEFRKNLPLAKERIEAAMPHVAAAKSEDALKALLTRIMTE